VSDDLTTGLRDLAESGQAKPPVAGAEIRRRAGARRRRRRTAAAAVGACAATALAVTLLLNLPGRDTERDHRPAPAATPPATPSTGTAPSATVDLRRGILTYGTRELRVVAGGVRTVPTGRMKVIGHTDITPQTAKELGLGGSYSVEISSVLALRGDDGSLAYIGGLFHTQKTVDRPEVPKRWLALGIDDAAWLYKQVRPGEVFDIESGTGTAQQTPGAATSASPG
jgi:hypothetical protein